MARGKVKLHYIVDKTKREATLRKRKEGLLKKVYELATLCAIELFLVIYSPGVREPTIWPSQPDEVKRLYLKFLSKPVEERNKKTVTSERYVQDELAKIREQTLRLKRKNAENELKIISDDLISGDQRTLDKLDVDRVQDLIWFIEERKMKAAEQARMSELQNRFQDGRSHLYNAVAIAAGVPRGEMGPPLSNPLFLDWFKIENKGRESSNAAANNYNLPMPNPYLGALELFGAGSSGTGNAAVGFSGSHSYAGGSSTNNNPNNMLLSPYFGTVKDATNVGQQAFSGIGDNLGLEIGLPPSAYDYGSGFGTNDGGRSGIAYACAENNFGGHNKHLESNMVSPPLYADIGAGNLSGIAQQQGYLGMGDHLGSEFNLPNEYNIHHPNAADSSTGGAYTAFSYLYHQNFGSSDGNLPNKVVSSPPPQAGVDTDDAGMEDQPGHYGSGIDAFLGPEIGPHGYFVGSSPANQGNRHT